MCVTVPEVVFSLLSSVSTLISKSTTTDKTDLTLGICRKCPDICIGCSLEVTASECELINKLTVIINKLGKVNKVQFSLIHTYRGNRPKFRFTRRCVFS